MTNEEQRTLFERILALEAGAVTATNERAALFMEQSALRRLAERNESTLHRVLKALEGLAESQRLASEQANAALTIVQNALVLRPVEHPTE